MKFEKYFNREKLNITQFDEYPNFNVISEAGLSKLLQQYYEGNDFTIITAYSKEYNKKENIKRNRKLRHEFDKRKMGVYQLVGHWRECQIKGIKYKDCPEDKLVDVIERSYMVVRPEDLSKDNFKKLIIKLCGDFDQNTALISLDGKVNAIEPDGTMFKIGDKLSLGKIAQAYSQHVKKMNTPFTFEGVEVPSSISGFRCMKHYGFNRVVLSNEEYKKSKNWNDLIN